MKKQVDYSSIRGFNYTPSNGVNDRDAWSNYNHELIDREMGYAQKLNLNSARIFLPFSCYQENPEKFLSNVKDFVQTAWSHGISTNPIVYFGFYTTGSRETEFVQKQGETMRALSKTVSDPSLWHIGEEYFDRLYEAIGKEEGLLFWDISNEPGYTSEFVTWYDEEPSYNQDFRDRPNMKELKEKQEKTWEYIRHFCRYVKERDPYHDIGVGNIFIWETQASRTAELVDVIVFHDYSSTRARLTQTLKMAQELSKKYNKPVVDNEMCCLCRANPYDMAIQLHEEYNTGWYLFELMIGKDMWNRVHGVFYPDGTVRDPSIPAAILGFYRNRSESAICADINQEDYLNRAMLYADRVLRSTRQSNGFNHESDAEEILEVCEFIANLLEAGELVPMKYPPTTKIEALRRLKVQNRDQLLDYMLELLEILKKSCYFIKESPSLKDLRI